MISLSADNHIKLNQWLHIANCDSEKRPVKAPIKVHFEWRDNEKGPIHTTGTVLELGDLTDARWHINEYLKTATLPSPGKCSMVVSMVPLGHEDSHFFLDYGYNVLRLDLGSESDTEDSIRNLQEGEYRRFKEWFSITHQPVITMHGELSFHMENTAYSMTHRSRERLRVTLSDGYLEDIDTVLTKLPSIRLPETELVITYEAWMKIGKMGILASVIDPQILRLKMKQSN